MTLIEAVCATLRRLHDSNRTEETYVHWIRTFIRFQDKRHPRTVQGAVRATASCPPNCT